MLKFSEANAKTSNLVNVPALAKHLEGGRKVYSLDLPSGVTCPGARDCHSWAKLSPQTGKWTIQDGPHCRFRCFSASQEMVYSNLRKLRQHNYELMKAAKYPGQIAKLILDSIPKNAGIVRLHVGGDVFSQAYMTALPLVAFQRTDIRFYFYTKSLEFLAVTIKDHPWANLPMGYILPNLLVTGSAGGKFDNLLPVLGLRKAVVVFSEAEAAGLGLEIDHDDSHAACKGGDFALLIHGVQPKGSEAGKALSALKGVGSYSRKGG
jgi:hypothetical protein